MPWLDANTRMRFLDLTLTSVAENLALDEALLEEAEQGHPAGETLRLWESPDVAVVAGRSTRIQEEIDLEHCAALRIPVVRRCSGGASVLIGPGCFQYSLVLSYAARPELRLIEAAHEFVLGNTARALQQVCAATIDRQGISDLAHEKRKVSGNSLRCKRTHLLYHGTLLYRFPLALVGQCLRTPPRQPEYRAGRDHAAFLANLPVDGAHLRTALRAMWGADSAADDWPAALTQQLLRERYSQDSWNRRR